MQRHRNDHGSRERLAVKTRLQDGAQGTGKRHAVRIFEVMNQLAAPFIEDQGGPAEIEYGFAEPARSAPPLDRSCGHTALGTERRYQRRQLRPALWTCGSPSTLQNG